MEVTQPVDLDSNLISGFCSHAAEFSPSCRSRSSARWAGNPSAALSATGNTSVSQLQRQDVLGLPLPKQMLAMSEEDSRATSPIPGMLSAKSLSRKRIFVLQMKKNSLPSNHQKRHRCVSSLKSAHKLTPSICRKRVNAAGNRAAGRFSSSSQPSPIRFEILFGEEQQN